jgi:hypothetical protein
MDKPVMDRSKFGEEDRERSNPFPKKFDKKIFEGFK